jgi:hypothetical protein
MACTDVARVKAKATVINLIIFSSNVNLQDFRAAITAKAISAAGVKSVQRRWLADGESNPQAQLQL